MGEANKKYDGAVVGTVYCSLTVIKWLIIYILLNICNLLTSFNETSNKVPKEAAANQSEAAASAAEAAAARERVAPRLAGSRSTWSELSEAI